MQQSSASFSMEFTWPCKGNGNISTCGGGSGSSATAVAGAAVFSWSIFNIE